MRARIPLVSAVPPPGLWASIPGGATRTGGQNVNGEASELRYSEHTAPKKQIRKQKCRTCVLSLSHDGGRSGGANMAGRPRQRPAEPHHPAAAGRPESIGSLVTRLRLARGYSQLELAERLCGVAGMPTVSRHEVSRWEREERVPDRKSVV